MRLQQYLTEDAESVIDYKKSIFDLNVAIGQLEFMEKDKVPTEREQKVAFYEKIKTTKEKIVKLKQKIIKQSSELGEAIKPALKDILDKIPEPAPEEGEE